MAGARPYRTERPFAIRLSPTVRLLVIVMTVLFLIYVFAKPVRPLIEAWGALTPGFRSGYAWQPFTSLFLHFDLLSWIFGLIGLWFMGTFIELTQGRTRLLELLFIPAILANVVEVFVPGFSLSYGCGNGILALFVVNGRLYGSAQQQVWGGLFMQARHLALLVVGVSVLAQALSANLPAIAGTLVASAAGYALASRGLMDVWHGFRRARQRRRYQVLDGGRETAPRKKLIN